MVKLFPNSFEFKGSVVHFFSLNEGNEVRLAEIVRVITQKIVKLKVLINQTCMGRLYVNLLQSFEKAYELISVFLFLCLDVFGCFLNEF